MGLKSRSGLAPDQCATGRIWFHGNPWPNGHALKELVWSGRIDADGQLWFDLHCVTVDYADEYPESLKTEDEEEDSSWKSRVVWLNYHATSLSSTKWDEDAGFLAASTNHPMLFAKLSERVFTVDSLSKAAEQDDDDFAFHIYCLGHDAVADHKIRFSPRSDGDLDLVWTGLHANAYVGDHTFENRFTLHAVVAPPRISGIGTTSELEQSLNAIAPDALMFGVTVHGQKS